MGLFSAIRALRRRVLGIRHVDVVHYRGLIDLPVTLSKSDLARRIAEAERDGRIRRVEVHRLAILGRLRQFAFPWSQSSS